MPTPAGLSVVLLCALVMTCCGSEDLARVQEASVRSNLSLVRGLVNDIGRAALDSAGRGLGEAVVLSVDSSAPSWIARTEFASLLGASGRRVLTGPGEEGATASRWNVRGLELRVEYRDIRKPGLFSGPVVDRVVSASIASEISSGNAIAFAGTLFRSVTDTVPESRIAELESGSGGVTTGRVPDLRSIDRLIEPFVIIGATAAAILLFFQVRS